MGNLHSLRKALQAEGGRATVTQDLRELVDADVAVLPGVGAFEHVMESLGPAADALRARHKDGRPLMGVCIGLQALYDGSEEAPGVPGLGILPGTVRRLPRDAGKVPHMGWNTLRAPAGPFAPLDAKHVYYVHSYAAPVGDATLACSTYGMQYAAIVQAGNTLAFQFHPEKSSAVGREALGIAVRLLEESL